MANIPHFLNQSSLVPQSLEHARNLASPWYTDRDLFEWEAQKIFPEAWQFVAHVSEVAAPGDYVVRDIARVPVLTVRGEDNKLRAFYNVCRHRAGPVANDSGHCKLLRCQYHGWVYQLDGRLEHAPQLGDVAAFDRSENGLKPLQLKTAGSFLFARSQPSVSAADSHDVERIMEEIDTRVGTGLLAEQTYHAKTSYTINCNWKVYVDNFLEGYHIPQVHPALAKILDYRDYATETFDGYSLQHSPVRTATSAYLQGHAYYYFVFPNLMLNILPGRLQTNVVIPLAPDRCRVDFVYYYSHPDSDETQKLIAEDLSFGDAVQQEDIDICERVQTGMTAGIYEGGRLSVQHEACVHHWQEMLKATCRARLQRAG